MAKIHNKKGGSKMKGLLILFLAVLVGCAGVVSVKPMNPFEPPAINEATGLPNCTIYEDNGITGGLIYSKVLNPCAAQNILIFIAQGGYTFEAYQFEDFKIFIASTKTVISGGVSYTSLRALILKAVMDQNRKMGMLLFSASGLIDMFQGSAILHPDDAKLCVMSLNDLQAQVELLTVFN
jgi:hypothetical protein